MSDHITESIERNHQREKAVLVSAVETANAERDREKKRADEWQAWAAYLHDLINAAPALMDAAERVVRLEAKLQAVADAHQDACYRDQGEPCEVCDVLLFKSLSDFDVAALSEGDSTPAPKQGGGR